MSWKVTTGLLEVLLGVFRYVSGARNGVSLRLLALVLGWVGSGLGVYLRMPSIVELYSISLWSLDNWSMASF